jgi:hypothetical protein
MNSGIPFSPQNPETSHLGVLLYALPVYWSDRGPSPLRNMKLVQFSVDRDWGTDYSVSLFTLRGYSLFQAMFMISKSPSWPYCHMSMGMGRLFEFCFDAYHFGFCLEIGAREWIRS